MPAKVDTGANELARMAKVPVGTGLASMNLKVWILRRDLDETVRFGRFFPLFPSATYLPSLAREVWESGFASVR